MPCKLPAALIDGEVNHLAKLFKIIEEIVEEDIIVGFDSKILRDTLYCISVNYNPHIDIIILGEELFSPDDMWVNTIVHKEIEGIGSI